MRFIPTKFHAPLDYVVAAALIAAPWVFFLGLTTKQSGGYSYRKSSTASTAAG